MDSNFVDIELKDINGALIYKAMNVGPVVIEGVQTFEVKSPNPSTPYHLIISPK